jgi:hypothetical protein
MTNDIDTDLNGDDNQPTRLPATTSAYNRAAGILGLPELTHAQEQALADFYREMYPISEDTEVNATIARAKETCVCGSIYQMSMPAEFRDSLLKAVNTWRKYHICTAREYANAQT